MAENIKNYWTCFNCKYLYNPNKEGVNNACGRCGESKKMSEYREKEATKK